MGAQLPLSNDEIINCYVISDQLKHFIRDLHAAARQRMMEGYPAQGYVNSAPHQKSQPHHNRSL